MKYELIQKLKDAGFNLGCKGCKKCLNSEAPTGIICLATLDCNCHEPTLSELIEACNLVRADSFYLAFKGDVWVAYFKYVGYFSSFPERFYDEDKFADVDLAEEGETPEIAMANLWLALNPQ